MAKVAFVLANDFEDVEFRVPYDHIRESGHDVTIVGKEAGEKLEGKKGKEAVTTEMAASDADASAFDVLVIPGGYSPDKLRMQEPVVRFTRAFFEQGKPVAAVCHAGSLLIEADVVRGRTMTSWPSIRKDLENAGARWEDREVVVDDNLITSRKPDDLEAFCETIVDRIGAKV